MSREITVRIPDTWTIDTINKSIDTARDALYRSEPVFTDIALILGAAADQIAVAAEPRKHAADPEWFPDEPYLPVVLEPGDAAEWVTDTRTSATLAPYKVFRVIVRSGAEMLANPDKTHSSVSFTIESVIAWDSDTHEPAQFERYATATIKWDSCSHINFGEYPGHHDGYLHMCGVQYFRNHVRLVGELYELAFRYMGRDPLPGEAWT